MAHAYSPFLEVSKKTITVNITIILYFSIRPTLSVRYCLGRDIQVRVVHACSLPGFSRGCTCDTIDNEYMFGKSLLVCPVTEKACSSQQVYLPAGAVWHDFWTGDTLRGGQTIDRATPINILPLYVRAGSILPLGPKVEYA